MAASVTLKKTDMRDSMRHDPKELASQYRLSSQPRKRSVNVIKRSRDRSKSRGNISRGNKTRGSISEDAGSGVLQKGGSSSASSSSIPSSSAQLAADGSSNGGGGGGGVGGGGGSKLEAAGETQQGGGGGGGHQVKPGTPSAMYLRTTAWGKMDDICDEYHYDIEEEDNETPETPKEEPHCQKKYRALCHLLRCQPIKHFLRSLVTDQVAVKDQKLSKEDIKACAIALLHTDSVEFIWFDSNSLGAHGASKIIEILPKKNELTELRLTNNRLWSEGARVVCEALKHNSRVRKLDLSGNELCDEDAELFKDLLETNFTLRALNLSHNNFRERGGEILGSGLGKNRTLQKLDLGWNHLRMAGAVAIGKGLKDNQDLEELILAWNGFHLRGCMALGEAMAVNNSLTTLDITCNRVSELSLAQLLTGLKHNVTLEKLLLPMNPLSPHAAFKVLKFIDENEGLALKLVDLGTTCVYEEFETYLEELKTRRDIEVLRGPLLRTGLQFIDPLASDDDGGDLDNPLIILMEYCRLQNLRLIDMFKALDKDGSKSLSYDEFKEGLKTVNIPMTDDALDTLMSMLDADGDGEIDFSELVQGQKDYKDLLKDAMRTEGGLEASNVGRVGMRMKEKFSNRLLMRKF